MTRGFDRRRSRGCLILLACGLGPLFGCHEPAEPAPLQREAGLPRGRPIVPAVPPPAERPAPVEPERLVIGRSVQGRPIEALVFGSDRDAVLILATIHGDEPAGTPLVRRLAEYLSRRPEMVAGRKVILIPVANPDGMALDTRCNARGIDLNRNFPAANFRGGRQHGVRPLSEPETQAIHRLVESYRPSRVVSIHQPYGCIDYDGPAQALAEAMARCCDLPVRKVGGRPGSLGSFSGLDRRTAIVTVEFNRSADYLTEDDLWKRYGRMLLATITFPEPAPDDHHAAAHLAVQVENPGPATGPRAGAGRPGEWPVDAARFGE